MFKWLHHLFNPHCELCMEDKRDEMLEYLRIENARLQIANDKLVERLLNVNVINLGNKVEEVNTNELQEVKPKFIPWHVRRRMLEDKDREEAQILARKREENRDIIKEHTVTIKTNELEKEVLESNVAEK